MMKHDQGITCTLMTLLLLAALSYLSVNAQITHAVEATTAELMVPQDSSHAPNPTSHENIIIHAPFQNASMSPLSILSTILSSEQGQSLVAHLWHHAPNDFRELFFHR